VRCSLCEVGFQTRLLGIPLYLKKKVRSSGGALPGEDMQKPYAPKYGQEKTKIDLFRDLKKNHQYPSYEFYSS
jgi:hypothetical protein